MNHITKKRKFQYVTSVLLATVCFLLFYLAAIWIMGSTKAVELPSEDEPKATGMLVIPARLTEQEREIWDAICQRDNERVLAMKLARQESNKSSYETEESEDETQEPVLRYLGKYKITGYDPFCSHCCGKTDGITTSGEKAIIGETVAMYGMEFGTRIYIDGLGEYTVHDRGVGPGKVDVACDGHQACYAITGWRDVYVVEDGE